MCLRTTIILMGLFTSAVLTCGAAADEGGKATARMQDRDGGGVGTVELQMLSRGLHLHARLENLSEGARAFHIHQTGKCEPPFKSAGGHFNPENTSHGFESPKGPHMGDFPNIHVPANGKLEIEYFNTELSSLDALFDEDGSAIIIHEKADDYSTDPAGAAGPRIACGVIERN